MVSLAKRAWKSAMAWTSMSTMGVALLVIIAPIVVLIISAFIQWRNEGRKLPLSQVLLRSLEPTAIGVVVPLALIILLFAIAVVKTLIKDHRALLTTISEKDARISSLYTELEQLKHPKIPFSSRARLEIVGLTFPRDPFEPNKPIYVSIHFDNTGPIPAEKVILVSRIAIVSSSALPQLTPEQIEAQAQEHKRLSEEVMQEVPNAGYGGNSIMPQKRHTASAQYPLTKKGQTAVTVEEIQEIKAKTKAIAVAGVIKYIDEYGPRETHFCYTFHGDKPDSNIWTSCFSHNEIVSIET